MRNSIIESVNSLPPLSQTIIEINKIFAKENSTVKELVNVVEKDPMLVANILRIANSPLYGFSREIKNILQAVNLFGMSKTRAIVLDNSVRKLLNVDMQPYGVTSDEFATVSLLQAALVFDWYGKISNEKALKLYLGAFLQETGKILIANEIIKDDESISFSNEIENSNDLSSVEKAYLGVTSGEVTAFIFEHWGFDGDLVEMIRYSDDPHNAPQNIQEYAMALNIVKTIIPINKPFFEISINYGLKKASDISYDVATLKNSIDTIMEMNK